MTKRQGIEVLRPLLCLVDGLQRQLFKDGSACPDAALSSPRSDSEDGAEVPDLEEISINICRAHMA
jgi:hypothetical protein